MTTNSNPFGDIPAPAPAGNGGDATSFDPETYEVEAPASKALARTSQTAMDLSNLHLPAEMLEEGAQTLAHVLQQAAELGIDLADENALDGTAGLVPMSMPRLIIQQRRNDKQPQLEIGLFTVTMPLEQTEEIHFVVLDMKLQRQFRPKYDPDKDEQDPTHCWSRDCIRPCGGAMAKEKGWLDGKHVCGDSRNPRTACPHNVWRDGRKGCDDVFLMLIAKHLGDGRYEPLLFIARKSSAGAAKAIRDQRISYGHRYGGILPQQLSAFRKLTVGFSAKLERVQERGKDYYRIVLGQTWEVPKQHLPQLLNLALSNKTLFAEIDVEYLVDDGSEEEADGQDNGYAKPEQGQQPQGSQQPQSKPSNGNGGSRPARW